MDNDAALLAVAERHLGGDPRLKLVCQDGQEFVRSLRGQQFDLIFADTWAGKYQLLDETLALLAPGGLYVIDDMLPQPNWPEGHAEKVDLLLATLCNTKFLKLTSLHWATGMVVAARVA
jgi:predicted O-methyltransferase YrrM